MAGGGRQVRVILMRPDGGTDAFGGEEHSFTDTEIVSARFDYQSGDEAVQAARLAGRSVVRVKLYSSVLSRQVTTGWQLREVVSEDAYNIVDVNPWKTRGFIYLTVEGPLA
ncbi:head-tail adaptor protein [Roseovarius pacificus]|uniref:phage head completion protein n=1 Tax=Roseovarius pacificus TaxID=337701 RepID=UPI002A18B084|nr:head-tail adaptor protein [Roseovarius pacificus]